MSATDSQTPREQNQERMQKTTADFSQAAQLTDAEFDEFMRLVQAQSEVLSQARDFTPSAESGAIPQLDIEPRQIRAVGEGESTSKKTIASGEVPYATQKVSLPWEQTWEENNELIDDPAQQKVELFSSQFGRDLEILASVGDEAGTGNFVTIQDGWLTIAGAQGVTDYDHGASAVNTALFEALINKMPERYQEQQNLVFLMSYDQKNAYGQSLTDRQTGAGDRLLLSGDEPTPFGHTIMSPLGWPSDRVMMTSMQNLAYVVQDEMRLKSTNSAQRNVMNDIDTIYNLLAKVDYAILETAGVVTASNIAAP